MRDRLRALSPAARILVCVWALFALLVAFGVHGSSAFVAHRLDASVIGDGPTPRYVLSPVGDLLHVCDLPEGATDALVGALEMEPRGIRSDEWGVSTPWALAQFAHDPQFPVVNTNIGAGQVMLMGPHTPVLHPTALARPSTWGYLFLGPARGLAWSWWFSPFACFSSLLLLFGVAFEGRTRLAAFAAFWYCASAFAICWSNWASYMTFFPAAATFAAYRLLATFRSSHRLLAALVLGLALPGFLMCSYPAWQVPLAWWFLALFVALIARDGLLRADRATWASRVIMLALGLGVAAALTLSYVRAAMPAMKALLGTVYPGSRFHAGGGYGFAWLLRGYYNVWTSFVSSSEFHNPSEASSFVHLFPAALFGLALSPPLRRRLGGVGWVGVSGVVFALVYMLVGFPRWLAALTLMSRSHPPRADILLGLSSIFLCCLLLARLDSGEARAEARQSRVPLAASALTFVLVLLHGHAMRRLNGDMPAWPVVPLVASGIALVSYALLTGRARAFAIAVGAFVLVTSGPFNPLAVGVDAVRGAELVREVARIDRAAGDRPLWLCYGAVPLPSYCGTLVSVAGARSLSGVHQYPQLDLWRKLDPDGKNERAYNRYAHVSLEPADDPDFVSWKAPIEGRPDRADLPPDQLVLKIAPTNPRLRALGARFVVAVDATQEDAAFADLVVRYKSPGGKFSIFELPR